MKDVTQATAEKSRPHNDALHCVNFCLKHLYADTKKSVMERVAHELTYEELIGALLLARDAIEELERLKK